VQRRVSAVSLVLLISVVGGCAQVTPRPAQLANASYICRPNGDAAASRPDLRLTVQSTTPGGRLALRFDWGDWQSLSPVPDSSEQIYANALYAWRFDGAVGVLSDINNIQTYNCVGDNTTQRPA
jgi:hypothetical protein